MDLASLICTLIQPAINAMQALVNFSWTPLTWLGFAQPSVASWFQWLLPCQLS